MANKWIIVLQTFIEFLLHRWILEGIIVVELALVMWELFLNNFGNNDGVEQTENQSSTAKNIYSTFQQFQHIISLA